MPKSLGFGLERLGYFSLSYPKSILVFIGLLYIVMTAGASQLQFESDTRSIFRSNTAEFARFEEFSRQYPEFLNETLILVEGKSLFAPKTLEALRSLHLDLELLDDVQRVVSIFSARHTPISDDDNGRPIVPDTLDKVADIAVLRQQIETHPLVKDKLVAKDGNAMIFVVTIAKEMTDVARAEKVLAELRETVNEALEGVHATGSLTGAPIFRTEIIASLQRDQTNFIATGLMIGMLLSYLFFRRLKYVLIVSLPGAVVISTLLGCMWLVGQNVNVLTSMVTPLVTVITLSNALHLTFAIRRGLIDGLELKLAIKAAIEKTGPSCVLSCLTTALALLTLAISPLPLIANFGLIAVCGALLSLFGMMLVLPALAYVILSRWPSRDESDFAETWLSSWITWICRGARSAVANASVAIALASIVVVLVLGSLHALNQPRYTTAESLPEASQASITLAKIDGQFAGISRLRLFIEWPDDQSVLSHEAVKLIHEANEILASAPWIRTTWSLDNIVGWLRSDGMALPSALKFVERNRKVFEGDLINLASNSAVITGYFPDMNSVDLIPRIRAIEKKLEELRARWPKIKLGLAGFSRLEALTNAEIISTLNYSLQIAIAIIIVLIAIAMRSLKAGIVSIVPNILPIVAGGTFLYFSGYDLQITSVVAFTVGFGIAVDSTIHFLGRFKELRTRNQDVAKTVKATLDTIGPVLVVSTMVMIAGLSVTLFSNLPMVQLYGKVSVLVLGVALVADLLVLPAILVAWNGLDSSITPGKSQPESD